MKKGTIKMKLGNFLITFFLFIASINLVAQEKPTVGNNDFEVIIEQADHLIKMKCKNGCAWKELTFNSTYYQPHYIDQFGLTKLEKNAKIKDENLADFLFEIKITLKGFKLKGIKGTNWTELSFPLSRTDKQFINKFGLTKT